MQWILTFSVFGLFCIVLGVLVIRADKDYAPMSVFPLGIGMFSFMMAYSHYVISGW
jgi:hypothetical protein